MKSQSDGNFYELVIFVLLIIVVVLIGFVMAQTLMNWAGF